MKDDISSPLRRALRANAVFSGVSGLVLLTAAGPMARFLGVGSTGTLRITGGVLLFFAASLVFYSGRQVLRPSEAWTAVAADLGWVIGSILILLLFPDALSPTGRAALTVVSTAVGLFALAQFLGLRHLRVG